MKNNEHRGEVADAVLKIATLHARAADELQKIHNLCKDDEDLCMWTICLAQMIDSVSTEKDVTEIVQHAQREMKNG